MCLAHSQLTPQIARKLSTYHRQFRNQNHEQCEQIDSKHLYVVVRVVRAQQEKHDRNSCEKLLRWSILCTVVHLLPHVELVVRARIEIERYSLDPVEHQEGARHVGEIRQCPA